MQSLLDSALVHVKPHKEHYITLRVQVPNNLVLGFWVRIFLVQVLGKYIIVRYLDP